MPRLEAGHGTSVGHSIIGKVLCWALVHGSHTGTSAMVDRMTSLRDSVTCQGRYQQLKAGVLDFSPCAFPLHPMVGSRPVTECLCGHYGEGSPSGLIFRRSDVLASLFCVHVQVSQQVEQSISQIFKACFKSRICEDGGQGQLASVRPQLFSLCKGTHEGTFGTGAQVSEL